MLLPLLIHCLPCLTTAALSLVSVKEWPTLTSQTAAKDCCILCLYLIKKTPKAARSEAWSVNVGMNFRKVPKTYVVNKKTSLKKDRHDKKFSFISFKHLNTFLMTTFTVTVLAPYAFT